MTNFPLKMRRLPEVFTVHFRRLKRHSGHIELRDLGEKNLRGIGLERSEPDFDAVKPFWMP
jgi:uncharacterized protein YjiS (DUF1127 family)